MPTHFPNFRRQGQVMLRAGIAPCAVVFSLLPLCSDQASTSAGLPGTADEVETPQASPATLPLHPILHSQRSSCASTSIREGQPKEIAPLGLWRTTAPTTVASATNESAPELARLPVNAALWPTEVREMWSRVRGYAGAVTYTGYIRSISIMPADK
jgi:hypothetical protein